MWYLSAEIILGSRGYDDNGNGWMQILVFIVIGVIYALSGILKARGNKIKNTDFPGEKPEDGDVGGDFKKRPTDAPRELVKSGQQQPRYRGMSPSSVKPAGLKFGIQKFVSELIANQLEIPTIKKPTEKAAVKKFKPTKDLKARLSKPRQAEPAAGGLFGLEQTDELKKAILYYEILGKPLALRDRCNEIAGF